MPTPRWCIAHHCEGDFGIEVCDDQEACRLGLRIERESPQQ